MLTAERRVGRMVVVVVMISSMGGLLVGCFRALPSTPRRILADRLDADAKKQDQLSRVFMKGDCAKCQHVPEVTQHTQANPQQECMRGCQYIPLTKRDGATIQELEGGTRNDCDLHSILNDPVPCGDVCDYNAGTRTEGKWGFHEIVKEINCSAMFLRQQHALPSSIWPPPKAVPENLRAAFLMDSDRLGRISVSHEFYQQRQAGGGISGWSEEYVEDLIKKARTAEHRHEPAGYPGSSDTINDAISNFPVSGLEGAVYGSELPWVEAMVLSQGAAHVTTIEYREIHSEHSHISTMVPTTAAELWLSGEFDLLDFGVSFSSFEHAGLGRYGDRLNPFGDLEAMGQAWCFTKPGGLFYFAGPFAPEQEDTLVYNAHREYGRHRLPHLFASWEVLDVVEGQQPLYVLRKIDPKCPDATPQSGCPGKFRYQPQRS